MAILSRPSSVKFAQAMTLVDRQARADCLGLHFNYFLNKAD